MIILISGGTGLIGKPLVKKLTQKGHEVRILTRKDPSRSNEFQWNLDKNFIDEEAFKDLDCIIHLAGATISKKWTTSYKKELFSSRIDTVNLLMDYCKKTNTHLQSFISSSGINFYGTFTSDQILKESDGIIKHDFLADLSKDWEKAAEQFSGIAERTVCVRTAMVLAKKGGAFPLLKKTVDFNIGSPVGSGKQWMNWIHIDDLVNLYVLAVENSEIKGNYNAVADEVPTNEIFMKKLAKTADKYFLPLNVPGFVMKILFGEMSSIILEGTRASNEKIKSQGFDFKYSKLQEAYDDLV